jgi:hypothetical protein
MTNNQQPKKDTFDNILDFFFGNAKNTKRTFVLTGIVILLINIQKIILLIEDALVHFANFLAKLVNASLPLIIIIFVFIFIFKKMTRK